MSNSSGKNAGNGTATPAEQTHKSEPTNGAPPYSPSGPKPGPKQAIKEPSRPTPANDDVNPPMRADQGKADAMSKQQSQSMPSTDQIKGKWKQQVGAAKIAWGKLTEDELLRLEGHEQKLAGLVQERYAITRDEADKQVKAFFEKNKILQ